MNSLLSYPRIYIACHNKTFLYAHTMKNRAIPESGEKIGWFPVEAVENESTLVFQLA